jgi:hypothetical protein
MGSELEPRDAKFRAAAMSILQAVPPVGVLACRTVDSHAEGSTMNTFMAKVNAEHYRVRLRTEHDDRVRTLLHDLLLEEEKKLGNDIEQLAYVDNEIAELWTWIGRQQLRADQVSEDAAHAKTLLGMLYKTMSLYQKYRGILTTSISRNRLHDRPLGPRTSVE